MKSIGFSPVRGTVSAPTSKSLFQRAVAIASLASSPVTILADSSCDDAEASLRAAKGLGADLRRFDGGVEIFPGRNTPSARFSCGEAGLCLRMFAPVAACFDRPVTLMASGPLESRPVDMLVDPLRSLGASVETNGGFPPVQVKGPLRGGVCSLDGGSTSQVLTGLLIALPTCPEDSTIHVTNLKSLPYVKLTLALLERFGIRIEHDPEYRSFFIPGKQSYEGKKFRVEGDWSGASFLLVAGAIAGSVAVRGLNLDSQQADRAVLEALRGSGAEVTWPTADTCCVEKRPLQAFGFDAEHCPDLFPPLVALASCCEGVSVLRGISRLRHKESDRAEALKTEFGKLGVSIDLHGEEMLVTGSPVQGALVQSHQDHRIAMACAVAGLSATNDVDISGSECVAKSYPAFFEDLEKLGAKIV